MKTVQAMLISILLCASLIVTGQEDKKDSKFEIISYGGIGYTKLRTDIQPRYDCNANTAAIIINYKLTDNIGVATEFGFAELSGNRFNRTGQFYKERNLIKTPALLTLYRDLSEDVFILSYLGPYAQNTSRDRMQYLGLGEALYAGWNFGAGLIFSAQSDLSKFKTRPGTTITDQRKHRGLNTAGVLLRNKPHANNLYINTIPPLLLVTNSRCGNP